MLVSVSFVTTLLKSHDERRDQNIVGWSIEKKKMSAKKKNPCLIITNGPTAHYNLEKDHVIDDLVAQNSFYIIIEECGDKTLCSSLEARLKKPDGDAYFRALPEKNTVERKVNFDVMIS